MKPLTLLDLLCNIEEDQEGYFQVSTKKDSAEWDGQFGYYNLPDVDVSGRTWWFTNRLYPHTNLRTRRAAEALPIKFVRIDLELKDHSQVPSEAERLRAKEYGIATKATAGINTPHGVHLFYLLETPIADSHLKSFVLDIMKDYQGEMHADTPSWHPACMSRYVKELEFYQDTKVAWTAPVSTTRNKSNKQLTKSYLYSKVKLYKVQNLRNQGFPDAEITLATGISQQDLNELKHHPDFNWNAGDQETCLVPLGPTCRRRSMEQLTYKVFADRWWSYQTLRYCGIEELENVILFAQMDREFLTVRNFVAKNFKLEGKELNDWIAADVTAQFKAYADGYERKEVSAAKLKALKTVLGKREEVRAADLKNFSQSFLSRAFKIMGWKSKKVGKVWLWIKAAKQENNYEHISNNNNAKNSAGINTEKRSSRSTIFEPAPESTARRNLESGLDTGRLPHQPAVHRGRLPEPNTAAGYQALCT